MTSYLDTTRASYDTVAADYHKLVSDMFPKDPYHRALIGVFAELVTESGGGPVGDLGCGPGHVTAYLAGLGLKAFGVDLSGEMVAFARSEYPGLRFETGSLLGLDLPDGELAGALVWYSLVHTPADDLPQALAELYRVLRPGGHLVHAYKVGDGGKHLDAAYGHSLSLDVYWYQPDEIVRLLTGAGFVEVSTTVVAPADFEATPQGYVIFRKPA